MILIIDGPRLQTDDCEIVQHVAHVDGRWDTVVIHAETLPDWIKELKPGSYLQMIDKYFGILAGTLTKIEYDWTPDIVGRTVDLLPVIKAQPLRITLTLENIA